MSMSKKIYGVVALLVLMALVIFSVSAFSLKESAGVAEGLVELGNRATALNNIDKAVLRRTLLTRELNQTPDESALAELIKGPMVENEGEVARNLAEYEANIPASADSETRDAVARLRGLWSDFVRESNAVGDLALENTNNRASRINDGKTAFWDDVDKGLVALADTLGAQNDAVCSSFADRLAGMRTDLMRLRLYMAKYIHESKPEMKEFYAAGIGGIMENVDGTFAALIESVPAAKGGAQAKKLFDDMLATTGKATVEEIMGLVRRDANGLAMAQMVGPARSARIAMEKATGGYLKRIIGAQDESMAVTRAMERKALLVMAVVSAAGVLGVSILAWKIISGIVCRLNGIIGGLGASSEGVRTASAQVSGSSQSLAEGATEQAASLEQTSSALEQMASMTRQNADNAGKTTETMSETLRLVNDGSDTVRNVTTAMAAINESAEKIGDIIKTIEEIAFQTNLLALNAAVEAARAGEAGKGFAVVADEVRNLAQRSAQAAKDTSELIEGTVVRVRAGSDNVDRLAEGFRGIEEAAQRVGRLVTEISAATSEQAQGVDQVNTAVAQMDKVTQSNAASAEQSASASEELSSQAEGMKGMVDELVALVEGGRGGVVRVAESSFRDFDDGGPGGAPGRKKMLALPHHRS